MAGTANIAAAPHPHRRLEMTPARREAAWGYAFIGIWLVGFVIFTAGPLIASFIVSFTNFDLGHPETWSFVGLDNYKLAFNDPNVRQGLLVTFKFGLISIPLTMGASLGVALLVNHRNLTGR